MSEVKGILRVWVGQKTDGTWWVQAGHGAPFRGGATRAEALELYRQMVVDTLIKQDTERMDETTIRLDVPVREDG